MKWPCTLETRGEAKYQQKSSITISQYNIYGLTERVIRCIYFPGMHYEANGVPGGKLYDTVKSILRLVFHLICPS